jgi:drug/metabolite transporter (DMT)-like permease
VLTSEQRRGWAAAALTIALWASAFAAIRAALKSFDVGELSVLRLALAALVLLAVALVAGLRLPARRDIPRLLACGLTGMAGYQLLLNAGEKSVTAGTASILVNTGPMFVALLAARFLGERLTARGWLGIALGFGGALVIAVGTGGGVSVSSGVLLVLGAAVAQATFFVVQKPLLARYSAFEITTYAMVSGAVMLLPLAPSLPGAVTHASGDALTAVGFLALGASAIGFFSWAYANARLKVTRAASALYAVPAVAILVGWIWLRELPSAVSVIGGAVALSGVLLASTGRRAAPVARAPAAQGGGIAAELAGKERGVGLAAESGQRPVAALVAGEQVFQRAGAQGPAGPSEPGRVQQEPLSSGGEDVGGEVVGEP